MSSEPEDVKELNLSSSKSDENSAIVFDCCCAGLAFPAAASLRSATVVSLAARVTADSRAAMGTAEASKPFALPTFACIAVIPRKVPSRATLALSSLITTFLLLVLLSDVFRSIADCTNK